MSSTALPPIPVDTARAAETVFGGGNLYLRIGDRTGDLFADIDPAGIDRMGGQPAAVLARLALVTLFQYLEHLPDDQASEAVRLRTDWKYALHLPLNHPGIQPHTLCDFRRRLLAHPAAQQGLDGILDWLAAKYVLDSPALPSRDTTPAIAVCQLSRAGRMLTAMQLALEAIAIACPDWLRRNSLPHWYERYGHTPALTRQSRAAAAWDEFTHATGSDAQYLIEAVAGAGEAQLAALPEIAQLRREWGRQYSQVEGEFRWRPLGCADCGAVTDRSRGSGIQESR